MCTFKVGGKKKNQYWNTQAALYLVQYNLYSTVRHIYVTSMTCILYNVLCCISFRMKVEGGPQGLNYN
jgi:hypothetical protein